MENKVFGTAILAAGFSERFYGKKLETKLGDKLLLQWIIDTVSALLVNKAVLIGSVSFSNVIFDLKKMDVIINEKPEEGISRSVFMALNWAMCNKIKGLFIVMGDMPFIKPEDFKILIKKSKEYPDHILSCSYKKTKGFPTLIPEQYFHLMKDLEGDTGFSKIMKKHRLPHMLVERTWRNVFDIDTQNDIQKAKEMLRYV
ncbi:MAG: nucleotidyltransferase family protein [Petrotogales bacterium]